MTDDDLRNALRAAHEGDRPPSLGTILDRPPRTRRPLWLLAPAAVAFAVLLFFVLRRPAPPPRLDLAWAAPLDFLLEVPGTDLLRDTPRFDLLKGPLP